LSDEPLRNLVVVSDLHCGCRLGLVPPGGVQLDDGGSYAPSPLQRKLWRMWREFWDQWVPLVTKGEPYGVVCNGDALDGVHHNSVTQISHNLKDQAEIAFACLRPIVELCEGRYWHVRGTEAHVGKSGQEEERLAQRLGAVPNAEGQHARWDLFLRVGPALVHFLHHIGVTGSQAYEATAVHKELVEMFVESGRYGDEMPTVLVRSHRHRHIQTQIGTIRGPAYSVVTPGFQLKTPFAYKIAGARLAQPQIGGIVIRAVEAQGKATDTGEDPVKVLARVWRLERPKVG
jgi:hypothetical protein